MTTTYTAANLRAAGLYAKDGDTGRSNSDGSITITRANGATSTVERRNGRWATRVQRTAADNLTAGYRTVAAEPTQPTGRIAGEHCQNCGSTDYEDLHLGDQGYTACCNERVVYGCDPTDCNH